MLFFIICFIFKFVVLLYILPLLLSCYHINERCDYVKGRMHFVMLLTEVSSLLTGQKSDDAANDDDDVKLIGVIVGSVAGALLCCLILAGVVVFCFCRFTPLHCLLTVSRRSRLLRCAVRQPQELTLIVQTLLYFNTR